MLRNTLIAAMAGAALAAPAQARPPADPVASALPTIDRADADWLPAMKAGDAERLAEPYAADAVFVLPDGKVVVGHEAIVDLYRSRAAARRQVVAGGIHRLGARYGGDGLVFEWGRGGATTIGPDGVKSTREGAYLTVWKRNQAGTWRIIRNMAF